MLVLTSPPSTEPISLSEAKLHLRVDDIVGEHPDDSLITSLIVAARQYAESLTGRSFITQDWRLVLDGFYGCIDLERGPVQQILSLTYRDTASATQTVGWDAASGSVQRSTDGELIADLSSAPARIARAFGKVGPITLPEPAALTVNYRAGYGAAADVPKAIKQWMLLRIGSLYEQRQEVNVGNIVTPMPFIDALLDPYRIVVA